MAQKKAHEADAFLQNPDHGFRTILIYGPNNGLVCERAQRFAKSTGIDLDDPFCVIRIDADSAAANPNRIAEDAHTVSMFGGARLIWITGSTLRNLAGAVKPVLSTPPQDCYILIEAGDLKKTAPLRKLVEASKSAMALPCYGDDARALNNLIDEETTKAGLAIEPAARMLLTSLLGADRRASRMEVEKLCLYARGNKTIFEADVAAIVGDASAFAIDEVVDAASIGNITAVQNTLGRLFETGTHPSVVASAALRHFQVLHKARAEMDQARQSPNSIIARMRPPVMFRRKDDIAKALGLWQLPKLEKSLERLERTCLESRTNAELAGAIVSMALMAISIDAARQASR